MAISFRSKYIALNRRIINLTGVNVLNHGLNRPEVQWTTIPHRENRLDGRRNIPRTTTMPTTLRVYLQEDGHRAWGFRDISLYLQEAITTGTSSWCVYAISSGKHCRSTMDRIRWTASTLPYLRTSRLWTVRAHPLSVSSSSNGPLVHRSRNKARGRASPSDTGSACRWTP